MALLVTIGVVALLVFVRLLAPPVPGLLKMSFERWGKRNTIVLSAAAIIGAVVLIAVVEH
jgi:hypothetical protein